MDLFSDWVVRLPSTKLGKLGAAVVLGALVKDVFGSTVVFSQYIDWVFNAYTALGGLVVMAVRRAAE